MFAFASPVECFSRIVQRYSARPWNPLDLRFSVNLWIIPRNPELCEIPSSFRISLQANPSSENPVCTWEKKRRTSKMSFKFLFTSVEMKKCAAPTKLFSVSKKNVGELGLAYFPSNRPASHYELNKNFSQFSSGNSVRIQRILMMNVRNEKKITSPLTGSRFSAQKFQKFVQKRGPNVFWPNFYRMTLKFGVKRNNSMPKKRQQLDVEILLVF